MLNFKFLKHPSAILITLGCLFSAYFPVAAQQGNQWMLTSSFSNYTSPKRVNLVLDFNEHPVQLKVKGFLNHPSKYKQVVGGPTYDHYNICDEKGEVLLYLVGNNIFNNYNESIGMTWARFPSSHMNFSGEKLDDSLYFFLKFEESAIMAEQYSYEYGQPISEANGGASNQYAQIFVYLYNTNTRKLSKAPMKNTFTFNSKKYDSFDFHKLYSLGYLLHAVYENYSNMKWDPVSKKGMLPLTLLDSVKFIFFSHPSKADTIITLPLLDTNMFLQYQPVPYNHPLAQRCVFNNAGTKFYLNNTAPTKRGQKISTIDEFDVNIAAQKISFNKRIFYDSSISYNKPYPDLDFLYTKMKNIEPLNMVLTGNDSWLYVNFFNGIRMGHDTETNKYNIMRIRLFDSMQRWELVPNTEIREIPFYKLLTNYYSLKLGPDGKIYVYEGGKITSVFDTLTRDKFISVIDNPEELNINKLRYKQHIFAIHDSAFKYNKKDINSSVVGILLPVTSSVYKRVKFTARNMCNRQLWEFKNTSDSQYFVKYKWYFGDGDSALSYTLHSAMRHRYKLPGRYLVKLKAINQYGGYIWYGDTVHVTQNPLAQFNIETKPGCQWIAYNYENTSLLNPQNGPYTWEWSFGDGSSDVKLQSNTPTMPFSNQHKHIFTQSGMFTTRLILSDRTCKDTIYNSQAVEILSASRPGSIVMPEQGCTPLTINFEREYSDSFSEINWSLWPNGQIVSKKIKDTLLLKEAGSYQLIQELINITGCKTYDTSVINVRKGLDSGAIPELLVATHINNSQIELTWTAMPYAQQYQIFDNKNYWVTSSDTTIIKSYEQALSQNHTYHIIAQDQCNTLSLPSNIARTVFAKITTVESVDKTKFEASQITWTPYQYWPGGVQDYTIEYKYKAQDAWQNLATQADTSIQDPAYIQQGEAQKCYRIVAHNSSGLQSVSNEVCLPYQPVLFVPDAISLNNDGLNDDWKITNIGFTKLQLELYNRWGAQLFTGSVLKNSYSPSSDLPPGVYAYKISGTDAMGKTYQFSGTLQVIK